MKHSSFRTTLFLAITLMFLPIFAKADVPLPRKIEAVQDVFEKQSTRDGLRQEIYDLLYDERTGLPPSKYDDNALDMKTDALFQFFENSQHGLSRISESMV